MIHDWVFSGRSPLVPLRLPATAMPWHQQEQQLDPHAPYSEAKVYPGLKFQHWKRPKALRPTHGHPVSKHHRDSSIEM